MLGLAPGPNMASQNRKDVNLGSYLKMYTEQPSVPDHTPTAPVHNRCLKNTCEYRTMSKQDTVFPGCIPENTQIVADLTYSGHFYSEDSSFWSHSG
jgi:hypothetical protein